MSKRMHKPARKVRVGDYILTCYHPRTWLRVTDWHWETAINLPIMIDTERNRTWWEPDELVPCKESL